MIISEQTPIAFQDRLPEAVDVAIIGGGVIGLATAWYLTKQGISVLLCEKGRVAGEQSSRNWGWIRKQGRDADELPIAIDSQDAWAGLAGEIGEDVGFSRQGVAYLAETEEQLARHAQWLEVAKAHQLDTRLLTAAQADALIAGPPGQYAGALYTPSDACAEPAKAVPALARAARRKGALIRENCAVRGLDLVAGALAGIITEHGLVRTHIVICAAGAWSSLLLRHLGIKLPQLCLRATAVRTAKAPEVFTGNAAAPDLAFRRRQDGGYTVASSNLNEHLVGLDSLRHLLRFLPDLASSRRLVKLLLRGLLRRLAPRRWRDDQISPFERTRVLNPLPPQDVLAEIRERLAKRLPALAEIPFAETWAGMIDFTPDLVPVMDEAARYPGLFIATGFSGHGFGIGLGAGKLMAEMALGRQPVHDLRRFRLSRFSDGSRMRPGPGL